MGCCSQVNGNAIQKDGRIVDILEQSKQLTERRVNHSRCIGTQFAVDIAADDTFTGEIEPTCLAHHRIAAASVKLAVELARGLLSRQA